MEGRTGTIPAVQGGMGSDMIQIRNAVLAELERHRGEYISGEELAKRLHVSRNAVWKAIGALRSDGYPIDARTNCGYALSDGCDILSAQSVERFLHTPGLNVQVRGEVSSTNTLVRQAAEAGEPEGLLLFASSQTEGRGRRGRSFYSPDGGNLYMSALLRPPLAAKDAALVTTLAAVAVAEAVEEIGGRECGIKWVNDVYCGGKKICGILTEASLDCEAGTLAYAVVGIGINVRPPKNGFPEPLRAIAGAVFEQDLPEAEAASRLAAAVWDRFFAMYRRLPDTGFLSEYRRRSFLLGKPIDVLRPDRNIPAVALAIDAHAGLVVRYADGREETLSSGEVSVRSAE